MSYISSEQKMQLMKRSSNAKTATQKSPTGGPSAATREKAPTEKISSAGTQPTRNT